MTTHHDVAIVGAGLAGLSLAVRLAALPNPPSVVLIDRREDYARDHIWCHWAGTPHPFENCITHRWPRWTVGERGCFRTSEDSSQPYQRIPAEQVYDEARRLLAKAGNTTWKLGLAVSEIQTTILGATVICEDDSKLEANWVFDSRPPPQDRSCWSQKFFGIEVSVTTPLRELETVRLMDFQSAGQNGIRFFYVLPLSATSIFVEDTWIVPAGTTPQFSVEVILDYLREHFGVEAREITQREEGYIPMARTRTVQMQDHVTLIGVSGGAVRASSGYAFSRIQTESKALALAYSNGGLPLRRGWLLDELDRIFLTVLERYPERMPAYFQRLFTRTPARRLVRFMESRPTLLDTLAVMRALPPWPFLSAAGTLLHRPEL